MLKLLRSVLDKLENIFGDKVDPQPSAGVGSTDAVPENVVVQSEQPEQEKPDIFLLFPPGHFYSPIADPVDLQERQSVLWNGSALLAGIDLHTEKQLQLLEEIKPFALESPFPIKAQPDPTCYFYENDQFPCLDAEFLFTALRYYQPRRVIEIGSGYSTLITAEVNRHYFQNQIDFSCVEPYPRQFLLDGVPGVSRLVTKKVQEVDLEFFENLGARDLLFIDSSHVSKIGSDVNYLFFEVIPRLRPGVIVHVHDIFLPDEYPQVWMIDEGRNWNEQYVLRAFLQNNCEWQVLWAAHFMGTRHTESVQATFPRYPSLGGGGSLWIQRIS